MSDWSFRKSLYNCEVVSSFDKYGAWHSLYHHVAFPRHCEKSPLVRPKRIDDLPGYVTPDQKMTRPLHIRRSQVY